MQCYRRSVTIPYIEHVTNEEVLSRVQRERGLLDSVTSCKFKHFSHPSRHNSLAKDIMLGPMPGQRRQDGQKKQWLDDLKEWTGRAILDFVTVAQDRGTYHRFAHAVTHAR